MFVKSDDESEMLLPIVCSQKGIQRKTKKSETIYGFTVHFIQALVQNGLGKHLADTVEKERFAPGF